MTKSEIISRIAAEKSKEQCFIKFFKAGHRLFDIDLVEEFINKPDKTEDIDDFELLDMEQMWQTLIDLDPDRLTRSGRGEAEIIEWCWTDSHGAEKTTLFPFTPEGIMNIINDEFFA